MSSPSYPITFPRTLAAGENAMATLTHPSPAIWVLRLHSGPDNRLTNKMCLGVLIPAFDIVESEWRSIWRAAKLGKTGVKDGAEGGFVITGTGDKFFSNGLDYQDAISQPGFMTGRCAEPSYLETFVPTVAALNGHTFAGGYLLALACDYRVMTSGKAWACFNEIHFGAPLPPAFATLIRVKVGHSHPALMRKTVLEGHRFTPKELLEAGIVDAVVDGGNEKVLERAIAIATAMGGNARGGAWGLIKVGITAFVKFLLHEALNFDNRKRFTARHCKCAVTIRDKLCLRRTTTLPKPISLGYNYIVSYQAKNGDCGTSTSGSGAVGLACITIAEGHAVFHDSPSEIEQCFDAAFFSSAILFSQPQPA
ncbi:ECH domain-containing protein [Rhizoctonia solani AG-1 IA]|uniref:ECH domain-containing protein n=1 Tax=Thanatephorus cucumeris (strain AG1-IA) TaxID=983506 RepID=L8WV92_THACA|nr:ECH domain-containing protein [Rhizoctonia solani AG-1 IA]